MTYTNPTVGGDHKRDHGLLMHIGSSGHRRNGLRLTLMGKFLLAAMVSVLGFVGIIIFLLINPLSQVQEWWLLIPALVLAAGSWIFGVSWWKVRGDWK